MKIVVVCAFFLEIKLIFVWRIN